MKYFIILLLIIFALFKLDVFSRSVELGPGVMAPDEPYQTSSNLPSSFTYKGYTITPLANFSITAKVLSKENYSLDRESDLSPVDLALGWGPMSDEAVLKQINISQSNRWYHWQVQQFPIPRRDIETHSANMHMIPADSTVESALRDTKAGNIIELQGELVSIAANDGWHWKSSLTRTDTGGGACEVIWVESFAVKL